VTGSQAEQKITSAIDYVTTNDQFKIYFANGNGETVPATFSKKLTDQNYTVDNVNLMTKDLPKEATMLFMFSPKRDYTVDEIAKLDKFMQNGGQLLVFIPPAMDDTYTNLRGFLNEWGLDFTDDYVVDLDVNHYTNQIGNTVLTLPDYVTHDITQDLISGNLHTALYSTRSVKVLVNKTSGITTSELLKSSDKSYARTNYRENTDLAVKAKTDVDGPFALAAVASKPDYTKNKVARVLLVGSDMMLNEDQISAVEAYGLANETFVINAANWMQDKKENVSIPAKSMTADYVTLDASHARALAYMAIAIPIIVLIIGFVIWFRRRHL